MENKMKAIKKNFKMEGDLDNCFIQFFKMLGEFGRVV